MLLIRRTVVKRERIARHKSKIYLVSVGHVTHEIARKERHKRLLLVVYRFVPLNDDSPHRCAHR